MGLSFILIIGLIGVIFFILVRNPVTAIIGENNPLVIFLKNKKWFQNYWLSGFFLFLMNACLFFLTAIILYGIIQLTIPILHLLVMVIAIISSLFLWLLINLSWQGEKRGRLKMAILGSSFFIILTFIFIYQFVTIEPMYPGDDTFMRSIGFLFGIVVTSVAFISCFILTGFTRRNVLR